LTLLTMKACRDVICTAAMDKDARHSIKLEDGNLKMTPTSFDATGEDKITVTDWVDAAERYVGLLGRHLLAGNDKYPGGPDAQKVAAEWEGHFRLIRKRPNFLQRFDSYRTYDIMVRRICQNQLMSLEKREDLEGDQDISPNTWHADLYKQIIEDDIYSIITPVPGSSAIGSSSLGTNSSSTTRSRHPASEMDRPRRSAAGDAATNRCMYCGKRDHHYRRCRGVEGMPIQRNKDKRWVDKDGKSYCFGFNGPTACSRGDSCLHVHACSLCLGRDHGAQRCALR